MKKNDKTPKTKPADSERETRVLLEDIRHSVKTVAENHSGLSSKLNNIDDRLSKIESTFFKNEWAIESIKNKVGTIDTKIDRIESVVLDINNTIKDNGKRITKLEEKVLL